MNHKKTLLMFYLPYEGSSIVLRSQVKQWHCSSYRLTSDINFPCGNFSSHLAIGDLLHEVTVVLPEVFLHVSIVAFSSRSILRPSLHNHTTVIALGQAEVPIGTGEVFPKWTGSSRHLSNVRICCS